MGLTRRLVAVALAPLAVLCATHPAAAADRESLRHQAEVWTSAPLSDFLRAKAEAPAPFDWTDDGCSVVPDRPLGYDFHAACQRHDFGYRNFGSGLALDRSAGRRARLDRRFRTDLLAVCRVEPVPVRRQACRAVALVYYEGVRLLGRGGFTG